MFIASSSTTVKFHSFPDGEFVYNYQPGAKADGPVRDISWSKDGMWLSLVPDSGPPEIISVRSQPKLLHTVTNIAEPSCTAFQNNTKKFIAYGTKNGQVLVYDIKSRKMNDRFPKASSSITHLEYTARDTHLVAGCSNGDVLLFSNLTFGLSSTYKIPRSESVSALKTNPSKRNFIIGGSNEGVVVVWDTNVNKHKFFVESHKAPVTGVAFSPINSNLVISTGADRQFCCYDVISNKCIARVPVNNNMTALDFSHDGVHIIMSSQKGKICLYDSRSIIEPVLVFDAHNTSIKNIALQKHDVSNTFTNISEEKVISDQTKSDHEDSERNNESFRNMLHGYPEAGDVPDFVIQSLPADKPADSFMVAMGLDNTSENGNSMCETSRNYGEGDHKWNDSKPDEDLHKSGPLLTDMVKQSICEVRSYLGQKQISTSTPTGQVIVISKLDTHLSPITNPNVNIEAATSLVIPEEQISKITERVEKKFTELFSSFIEETKLQFFNTNSRINQVYLDLLMAKVKSDIKMGDTINTLREEIASNSQNYLLEENLRLKRQIALLEEQLACKSESMNGN